jgi:hypothetical protein
MATTAAGNNRIMIYGPKNDGTSSSAKILSRGAAPPCAQANRSTWCSISKWTNIFALRNLTRHLTGEQQISSPAKRFPW